MQVRYLVCCCCAYSMYLREHETSLRSCNNEAHRCIVAMYHRSYVVHDRVHFAAHFFVSPYLHVPSFALPLRVERKKIAKVVHTMVFVRNMFLSRVAENSCRVKITTNF